MTHLRLQRPPPDAGRGLRRRGAESRVLRHQDHAPAMRDDMARRHPRPTKTIDRVATMSSASPRTGVLIRVETARRALWPRARASCNGSSAPGVWRQPEMVIQRYRLHESRRGASSRAVRSTGPRSPSTSATPTRPTSSATSKSGGKDAGGVQRAFQKQCHPTREGSWGAKDLPELDE